MYSAAVKIIYNFGTKMSFSDNNNLNSTLTVGQLFDKAVDKVMSDKVLRNNVESGKSSHPWPFGKIQASVGSSMSIGRSTVVQSAQTYSWGTKSK